jgi:hypothetical protein
MGSPRPRNSNRARKSRPRKDRSSKAAHPVRRVPPDAPRTPVAVELAIEDQREALATSISLLYCLHSAMHREIDDGGKDESEAVVNVSNSADLTAVSSMLLVRLDAIHSALDSVELAHAKQDPELVALAKAARKIFSQDEDSQP